MITKTRFIKTYITIDNKNEVHFLYENKIKNLLLRLKFDLNIYDENICLEKFIDIIILYETQGLDKYNKIEHSRNTEDSHNHGE